MNLVMTRLNRNAISRLFFSVFVLVATWWVFSEFFGDALTIIRWLNYAAPWLGLLMLTVAAVSFYLRVTHLGIACVGLALLILSPYSPAVFGSVPAGTAQKKLSVLSYNLMTRNTDMAAAASVISGSAADLILLQEVNDPDALLGELGNLYGNGSLFVARDDDKNLMILSRYRLTEQNSDGKVQRARLSAPMGEISLRNLHAVKALSGDAEQLGTIQSLALDVSAHAAPVIVAGDFNFTQANDGYRELSRWLRNTQEEAGVGLGFTFPTPTRRMGLLFPFVRIDHLFVSRHFDVTSFETLDDYGGSDHYPISATLSLSTQSEKLK